MTRSTTIPSWRVSTFVVCALSLSIGWGIRGNFGHEYGAMIPGALTGIAVCLLSGREDWRRRVAYFGFFGAVGWGFGGSMSYGQVIGYTHTGHFETQLYGFAMLYVIGFLWGAIGGAGIALPAVADRQHLARFFTPLLFIFPAWLVWDVARVRIARYAQESFDASAFRHESPFYWFDADWTLAVVTLLALGVFDLWQRRELNAILAPVYGAVGAGIGYVVKVFCDVTRVSRALEYVFVRPLGDLRLFRRAEELGVDHESFTDRQRALLERFNGDAEAFREQLATNMPAFMDYEAFMPHFGWALGLLAGLALYFYRYGRLGWGTKLYLYMAVGFLVSFVIFPVLLGIRMTPPRSDSWAGTLGVFLGVLFYLFRTGLFSAAYASIVAGLVGGVGFAGSVLIKLMLMRPGRSTVTEDPAVLERWAHYQSSNWHSVMEQTYGLINGLGVALAMAFIASRAARTSDDPPVRRWTAAFSVAFVLLWVVFVNWRKAVGTWVDADAVPSTMKMPWFESVELSAQTWFAVIFWIAAAAFLVLLARHLRKPIAIVPATYLGKGMLFYLVFLWVCVIFNFERALTGFGEGRLITEGVIIVNAAIATALLLLAARSSDPTAIMPERPRTPQWYRAALIGIVVAVATVSLATWATRAAYGDEGARPESSWQLRFGPDAEWRVNPLLKERAHN